MSRKVYVNVTVRLIVAVEDDVEISDVIDELDYNFSSGTDGADIVETEITNHEVAYDLGPNDN